MSYAPPVNPHLSRLTSGYGVRPGRRTGAPTYHSGADFAGRTGEPVYAVADGVVEVVIHNERPQRTRGYGNIMAIRHPNEGDVRSVYAHLDRVHVQQGQSVQAGQLIGQVGNTTNGKFPGMGSHLHFEVRQPSNSGGPPLPGPYRVYNLDPVAWLAERGVQTDAQGGLVLHEERGAHMPSPMQPLAGLAGLGQVPESELDMGAEGLPMEPVRDPWTFVDPVASSAVVAVTAAGVLTAVGVGFLVVDVVNK